MTNEQNQTLRFSMRGQGPSNTNASASGDIAESKAIKALQLQSDYSSLQRVGGTYWDAASSFGNQMVQGNPSGKSLQSLLNEMVTGITGEESTGDAEGVEAAAEEASTEEAAEAASEDASTDEASEAASDEAGTDSSLDAGSEASSDAASEASSQN
jgi:arabinogalactan oligomer/maltooligosaccharide transport system substrate-binding protein